MRTTRWFRNVTGVAGILGLSAVTLTGCGGSTTTTTIHPAALASASGCKGASQSNVVAPAGFRICLFVAATSTSNHPDNVVISGTDVYVGWQNITAKDGTDTKTSTITRYTNNGKFVKSWKVGGHTDGMRMDPASHLLWVMSNEDGMPKLYTINPSGTNVKSVTLPATPHGGGFDDIQFVHGTAVIDASNPTLDSSGTNVFPALYTVQIQGSTANLTPVLMGNDMAGTLNPPAKTSALNLTDPDSMIIDPQGDLVLTSQGDSEMLFITNVGTPQQTVKTLSVGTQIDDTVWPTSSKGCIIVADGNSGVYSVCSNLWVPGSPYTAAPNDSGVGGFVGTLSLTTGFITPVIVGIANPHGMGFLGQ